MPQSTKHSDLAFEPSIQVPSELSLLVPEDNEEFSSGSFSFSYPSSSPPSSPLIPGTPEEEEEEQEEEEEEQEEEEERGKKEAEEEEKRKEVKEEVQEKSAAESSSPPQSPQRYRSGSTSVGGSSSQENEDTSSLQTSADAESLVRDPLDEKVARLVHFMILRYRLKKPVTEAEMVSVLKKGDKSQFPVIFKKACKCLEVISGIDVKEVAPATHSYVLVNALHLTNEEMPGDLKSIPKNGLLMIILGLIFIEGNSTPEEDMWEFLNILGVYAGREHFIYGEPRKLITTTWVQEKYLEYQQIPNSDPPRYKFLWGARAQAETTKLQVLEFLVKIKGTDPISFSHWYEVALREEKERAQTRVDSKGHAAALFMAQQ